MKFLILSSLSLVCSCALAEYKVEELIAHGEKCGGTLEDLVQLSLYEVPSTSTGKGNDIASISLDPYGSESELRCMVTCMIKAAGILDDNGKYDKSNMNNFLNTRWSELKEYGSVIADNCEEKSKANVINDECEYGYEVVLCFADQLREKNLFAPLIEKAKNLREQLKNGTYKTPDSVKTKINDNFDKIKQNFHQ